MSIGTPWASSRPAPARRFVRKRFWVTLVALCLATGLTPLMLRHVGGLDQVLASSGARHRRALVHELKLGATLMLPIEPGTDMLRVTTLAGQWNGSLSAAEASLQVDVRRGAKSEVHTQLIPLMLPTSSGSAVPEVEGLLVSDPAWFSVDVRDAKEVLFRLKSLKGADTILIRAHRRRVLPDDKTESRWRAAGPRQRSILSSQAWETSWMDVEESHRLPLAQLKWDKAPLLLADGRESKPIALNLFRSDPPPDMPDWPLVGRLPIAPHQRASFVVDGVEELRVRSEPPVPLRVTLTREDGSTVVLPESASPEVPRQTGLLGVEVATQRAALLEVRSTSKERVHWYSGAAAFRATPFRPYAVRAASVPLKLRVRVRAPLVDSFGESKDVIVDITYNGVDRSPVLRTYSAALEPAPSDRFVTPRASAKFGDTSETIDGVQGGIPTLPGTFYLHLPANAQVEMRPRQGSLDFSVAEFDPSAPQKEWPVREVHVPAPAVSVSLGNAWDGFAPRRPSNIQQFDEGAQVSLLLSRRLVTVDPSKRLPIQYTSPAPGGPRRLINGRAFQWSATPLFVSVGSGARVLPLRFFADRETDVEVTVERVSHQGAPSLGPFLHLTLPRRFHLTPGRELRTSYLLGDDLSPGTYQVHFQKPPRSPVWVRTPVASKAESRWVAGEFDE